MATEIANNGAETAPKKEKKSTLDKMGEEFAEKSLIEAGVNREEDSNYFNELAKLMAKCYVEGAWQYACLMAQGSNSIFKKRKQ